MEVTIFERYCQSQAFRAILSNAGFHEQLGSLRDKFNHTFRETGSTGTLRSDVTGINGQKIIFDSQVSLPDDVIREVSAYVTGCRGQRPNASNLAFKRSSLQCCRSFERFGMTFSTSSNSPRNSNVIIGNTPEDWVAAEVKYILTTEDASEAPLLIVILQLFSELEDGDIQKDPYRNFPLVGGRIFYDKLNPRLLVVDSSSIQCHFARTTNVIPLINQLHFHCLPLDKVTIHFRALWSTRL